MRYKFKTRPYPHQRRALKKLLRNRGGGLQVPMRWGKTKVAIDFANCLMLMLRLRRPMRVLVACPLSAVGVWEDEVPKHTPDYIRAAVTDEFGLIHRYPNRHIVWCIVNFESIYDREYDEDGDWFPVPRKSLHKWRADLIIVDESHHLGNPTTVISKHLYMLGQHAPHRVIMTGTMFHRKPFYVFGQMKFLDASVFGTAFGAFKKRVAIMGGYLDKQVIRYINLKWMIRKVKPLVYMERYVPPRDTARNILHFHLTGRNLHYYAEMERESIIEVGGEEVISPIVLSRHLRCQQIAGGWVKTETTYRRVGDDKFKMCKDRFAEYAEQDIEKVVVGCRFIPELADAARAAKRAGYKVIFLHGGINTKQERQRRIKAFRYGKGKIAFISQIAAGKEAIDLSAADTMMFYSLPESFLAFDQFRARIRKYNEQRVLQYDFLIARGTRDEVTLRAMEVGEDVATFIIDNPELVEKITAMTLSNSEV